MKGSVHQLILSIKGRLSLFSDSFNYNPLPRKRIDISMERLKRLREWGPPPLQKELKESIRFFPGPCEKACQNGAAQCCSSTLRSWHKTLPPSLGVRLILPDSRPLAFRPHCPQVVVSMSASFNEYYSFRMF